MSGTVAEAARVERVVCGVIEAALAGSGADGVTVLDDHTPEGELVSGWLERALGADRVRRAGAVAGNMQGLSAARQEGRQLIAHPVNRTMLLLGGPPPLADLLPLGDVYGSWVRRVQGACTLSAEVQAAADEVGGIDELDGMLSAWIDARGDGGAVAAGVAALYERGRFYRLRPRLVPKLGPRTLGIDLWD